MAGLLINTNDEYEQLFTRVFRHLASYLIVPVTRTRRSGRDVAAAGLVRAALR